MTCTTVIDIHFIISNLLNKYQQKLFDKYYGNNTRLTLNKLQEIDQRQYEILLKTFDSFISQVIEYIKSYYDEGSEFYEKLSYFSARSFKFHSKKNRFNTKLVSKGRTFGVPYRSAELKKV